jgi:hypothetical protein
MEPNIMTKVGSQEISLDLYFIASEMSNVLFAFIVLATGSNNTKTK